MHKMATIYPTLWKANTIKGVPRDYAMVSLITCFVLGMLLAACGVKAGFYLSMVFYGFAWLIGLYLGRKDTEFLTVYLVKTIKIGMTKNGKNGNKYL